MKGSEHEPKQVAKAREEEKEKAEKEKLMAENKAKKDHVALLQGIIQDQK